MSPPQSSEPRSDSAPFHDDDTAKRNRKLSENTKRLCRYVTKLEDVVTVAAAGTLPEETYPWVRAPPAKGSAPQYDATNMSAAMASKAAHGEALNRYTAEVLASTNNVDRGKVVGKRRVKGSRFAKDDDGGATPSGGSGGGGSASGGSRGGGEPAANDPFSRALEAPKPRVYVSGRILVFVVGGVTQLEIAAMDKLSHATAREVIVGGTSLLTAKDYLEQLFMCEPGDEDDDDGGAGGFDAPGMDEF